jgi:hypothetical protein
MSPAVTWYRGLARFARHELGDVDLGDRRLHRRLERVIHSLGRNPARSIPQACGSWGETKSDYRFCRNPAVTREKILDAHYQSTRERLPGEGAVLVVGDTTYLDYSHHPDTVGVGPIGNRTSQQDQRGVLVHSALAVTSGTHRVLGLLDQEVIVREERHPANEPRTERRKRTRESQKWTRSSRRVLDRVKDSDRLIFVFDREADVFEVFEELQDWRARFVIRASWNRRLAEEGGERAYLLDQIRHGAVVGRQTIEMAARGGCR